MGSLFKYHYHHLQLCSIWNRKYSMNGQNVSLSRLLLYKSALLSLLIISNTHIDFLTSPCLFVYNWCVNRGLTFRTGFAVFIELGIDKNLTCITAELVSFLQETRVGSGCWPSKVDEIRILHLGRFLDDDKTLKGSLHDLTKANNLNYLLYGLAVDDV